MAKTEGKKEMTREQTEKACQRAGVQLHVKDELLLKETAKRFVELRACGEHAIGLLRQAYGPADNTSKHKADERMALSMALAGE